MDFNVTEAELDAVKSVRLPEETKREIILRFKQGQKKSEIRKAMGLTQWAVQVTLSEKTREHGKKQSLKYRGITEPNYITKKAPKTKPEKPVPAPKKPKEPKPTQRKLAIMSELGKKFNPAATTEDCINDLRRIQRENPYAFINRNMYRHHGNYSDATWGQYFGTFLEFRRKAGLELHRSQHAIEKQIAKHASLDEFREYYRRDIEPITMLYPRAPKASINTIACISDNHDLQQDPFVYRVFLDVITQMQPDVVLFNGDQADCYEFSKYTVDPRNAKVVEAMRFLRDRIFRAAREACPDSEIVWNLGNHEWRVQKHMAIASPYMGSVLADFHGWTWADFFGVRDFEININCKWDLGAFNKADMVHEVKNNWVMFWNSFVAMHIRNDGFGMPGTSGHIHKQQLYTGNVLSKGEAAPYSWTVTPSGCRGNAEYTDGFDKSDRGFAIFHVMPETGIVVPEPVLIQGDYAAVGGKYYYRQANEIYLPSQRFWS